MSLHPDIIDAMVAAGASSGMDPVAVLVMVQAACRAAWRVVQRNAETHETVSCNAETPARTTSTSRVQAFRARQKVKRETVSPVSSSPLSLIENTDPSREREEVKREVKRETVSCVSSDPMALPPDWQPDAKSRATAAAEGHDPEALAANFRDHYGPRPQDKRTPDEWQSTYRKWARTERKRMRSPQGELPIMRKVVESTGPPPWWEPGMLSDEELRQKWSAGNG